MEYRIFNKGFFPRYFFTLYDTIVLVILGRLNCIRLFWTISSCSVFIIMSNFPFSWIKEWGNSDFLWSLGKQAQDILIKISRSGNATFGWHCLSNNRISIRRSTKCYISEKLNHSIVIDLFLSVWFVRDTVIIVSLLFNQGWTSHQNRQLCHFLKFLQA